MKAHLNGVRMSPKKASVVANIIRGMEAGKALNFLRFAPNKPARYFYKALKSAMANAENNHDKSNAENFLVGTIFVNKGPYYKRALPSTRGRQLPISKPTTHITLELTEK